MCLRGSCPMPVYPRCVYEARVRCMCTPICVYEARVRCLCTLEGLVRVARSSSQPRQCRPEQHHRHIQSVARVKFGVWGNSQGSTPIHPSNLKRYDSVAEVPEKVKKTCSENLGFNKSDIPSNDFAIFFIKSHIWGCSWPQSPRLP